MEGIGTPESHDLEGGDNTFGNIVYLVSPQTTQVGKMYVFFMVGHSNGNKYTTTL
ncbi:unnamed protein product [Staurois parvus]|uniref:Uncharacterized protein n=1 Tax=Staurois parvus TaxID=386267 RepID=A0ABN9DQ02_9NEOB|nr:unnamed protein product [Staurois parvus]